MPNYNNARVYKIVSPSTGLTYYGATVQQLSRRMTTHRLEKIKYDNGARNKPLASYPVLDAGDAVIVLVELVPCDDKEHLDMVKYRYIRANACVNV